MNTKILLNTLPKVKVNLPNKVQTPKLAQPNYKNLGNAISSDIFEKTPKNLTKNPDYKKLSPANYKLTYKSSNGRGVYSFCMCPGGYVVNASSEEGRLAINGMSYRARDSINANSAIVVTVDNNDFGTHPLDGIKYQRELEEYAFKLGDGNIPIQLFGDYLDCVETTSLGSIEPIFKGGYKWH